MLKLWVDTISRAATLQYSVTCSLGFVAGAPAPVYIPLPTLFRR